MKHIYLDYAASTPTDSRVVDAMAPYWSKEYGNPSSIHAMGRAGRVAIDDARERIARIFVVRPSEVVFTGSGTEAINLALIGVARAYKNNGTHIITTNIEHHAVLDSCKALEREGFTVTYIKVQKNGIVDPMSIADAIRPDTILISVMYANNEIGTIQPIREICRMIKSDDTEIRHQKSDFRPLIFTDACQAAGALDISIARLGVDMMAINGSKIYGPKGIGVLCTRRDIRIAPMIHGGAQEMGRRSGTENVPLIVGCATALELVQKERIKESERLIALRDHMIAEIKKRMPDVLYNGDPALRLPNNINISIPDIDGDTLVLYLDKEGIFVSTGSACSSVSLEPSHVIAALDLPRSYVRGSLRMSLGRATMAEDLDATLDVLERSVLLLRKNKK